MFGDCLVYVRLLVSFIFWSEGGIPLSLRDNFLKPRGAGGHPRWLRDYVLNLFDGFGSPFGEPGPVILEFCWYLFLIPPPDSFRE